MDGACEQPSPATIRATVVFPFVYRLWTLDLLSLLQQDRILAITFTLLLDEAEELLSGHAAHHGADFEQINVQGRAQLGQQINTDTGIDQPLPIRLKQEPEFRRGEIITAIIRLRIGAAGCAALGVPQTIE